jgi:tetratricopeptide (TPR) repeat protein
MKSLWGAFLMLLFIALATNVTSAQTAPTQTAPPAGVDSQANQWHVGGIDPYPYQPSLPNGLVGSAPGRGLSGGKNPSIKISASYRLVEAGDAAAKREDWQTAESQYQAAVDLFPDNEQALYGLAKCAETAGDLDDAIRFYRAAIYSHDPKVYGTVPGDGYRTNNVEKMMDFVLVLSQAHQEAEAQKVYNRAASVLSYQDSKFNGGKPFLRVVLPEFGTGPDQIAETPQRLQAMAHVTLSIEASDSIGVLGMQEIQKALRLYPESPVVSFYYGEQLLLRHPYEAKAAYEKAAQLGDAQIGAAARRRLDGLPSQ